MDAQVLMDGRDFMKKLLKLAISFIVVFALLMVPMTVMAESSYEISDTKLSVGTNTYAIEAGVSYTVYIFNPTDVGEYTFTTSDGLMGIVSYLDMWVQNEPSEENVNLDTIMWECTDKNQAIMIAVIANSSEVSITVSRKDLDTSDEIEWTIYKNKTEPLPFEMPSFVDMDALSEGYVDFEDSVIDEAVLGNDGYYHLNDENGPILFANLDDSIMSLYGMSGYGKIAAIYYDADGDVTKKVDYTEAFAKYVGALPTNQSGAITEYYYPLTYDLIEMFKEIGSTHEWYSGETWIADSEDAWLFACYYDADVISMDPAENDTNNDTNNDANNDVNDSTDNSGSSDNNDSTDNTVNGTPNVNEDQSDKSPSTGDNMGSIVVAMFSAAAIAFGIKSKK